MTIAIRKYWFIALTSILVLAILGGIGYMFWYGQSSLPVVRRAPKFQLTNVMDNRSVSLGSLDGKVKLITFLYTRCPDECPATAYSMSLLQDQLKSKGLFGNKVVLVSITFDPQFDTPDVLRKFASHFHPDPTGWLWLRGNPNETANMMKQFGVDFKKTSNETFEHILKTELVDQNGNVRKLYETTSLDKTTVIADMQNLLSRG